MSQKSEDEQFELPQYFEDNFDELDVPTFQFIFGEVEKRLMETVKIYDDMANKCLRLLALIISSAGALIVYLTKEIGLAESGSQFVLPAAVSLCLLIVALIFLFNNIWGVKFHVQGSDPDELLDPEMFSEDVRGKPHLNWLLNQSYGYNKRIKENRAINKVRFNRYRSSLICLMFIPITPVLTLIFT